MKVILVGDAGVGKTCLSCYRTTNIFDPSALATVTASCSTVQETHLGQRVAITIWDTAGQERFRSMTVTHYRNAHVAFLCVDLTRPPDEIAASVAVWADLVRDHAGEQCRILLVGTKSDLIENDALNQRIAQAEDLRNAHNLAGEFMTSAKTGLGIPEIFAEAAGMHPMFQQEPAESQQLGKALTEEEKGQKGCC
jgi:small GTP-binding protein